MPPNESPKRDERDTDYRRVTMTSIVIRVTALFRTSNFTGSFEGRKKYRGFKVPLQREMEEDVNIIYLPSYFVHEGSSLELPENPPHV